MSIVDKLEAMQEMLEDARKDAEKADKGTKAAGTRVRKVMQEVITVAKDLRKEVLAKR